MHAYVYMHMNLLHTSPYFLKHSLLLNLELTDSVDQQSKPQRSSCFCLPKPGIIGACHHIWLYMWVVEIRTQVLVLSWQVRYRLSHLASPQKHLWIFAFFLLRVWVALTLEYNIQTRSSGVHRRGTEMQCPVESLAVGRQEQLHLKDQVGEGTHSPPSGEGVSSVTHQRVYSSSGELPLSHHSLRRWAVELIFPRL